MKTRARTTQTLTLLAVVALLNGCNPFARNWTESGIPKALAADSLLLTAGTPQEIKIAGGGGASGSGAYAVHAERQFHVTLSSGSSGQLVAAYRTEVKRQIENLGGRVHGTGVSANDRAETDVRSFSYEYTWGGNAGIVRVHSFVDTNGQVEIALNCYEHPR
jgi:hypothetical protein